MDYRRGELLLNPAVTAVMRQCASEGVALQPKHHAADWKMPKKENPKRPEAATHATHARVSGKHTRTRSEAVAQHELVPVPRRDSNRDSNSEQQVLVRSDYGDYGDSGCPGNVNVSGGDAHAHAHASESLTGSLSPVHSANQLKPKPRPTSGTSATPVPTSTSTSTSLPTSKTKVKTKVKSSSTLHTHTSAKRKAGQYQRQREKLIEDMKRLQDKRLKVCIVMSCKVAMTVTLVSANYSHTHAHVICVLLCCFKCVCLFV